MAGMSGRDGKMAGSLFVSKYPGGFTILLYHPNPPEDYSQILDETRILHVKGPLNQTTGPYTFNGGIIELGTFR